MSKAKEAIKEFREKLFETKKQEIVEEAQKTIENAMDGVTYDVIQNPDTKSRDYLILKIKYDLETRTAAIVEVKPFNDKVAGMSIIMDKENRKYLFEKFKGKKD